MAYSLAFGLLAVLVLLVAAIPWQRPHPNHVFALTMLARLADENPELSSQAESNTRTQPPAEIPKIRRR